MTKTMFRKEMSKLSAFIRQANTAKREMSYLIGHPEKCDEGLIHSMIVFCIRQLAVRAEDNNNMIYDYFFGKLMFTRFEICGTVYNCNSPAQLWETITAWNKQKHEQEASAA